jgi:pre-mRNA-splicing factor ATP-dependent RNA helicase DHX38/PRP16
LPFWIRILNPYPNSDPDLKHCAQVTNFFLFREARIETPSHTGGVNEEAVRRREEERRKRDERGIAHDSRQKRDKDDRDYFDREWRSRGGLGDRRSRDKRDDGRDRRDRDRGEGRERGVQRSDRSDGSEGGRLRERDGRRENDWENETPRSMRYDDEKLTPLIRQVSYVTKIVC